MAWPTPWLASCLRIFIFKVRIMIEPRMSLFPSGNSRIQAFRNATCSTNRTHEFAVRSALGAGQSRVIRQLLTESILIGLAGGALGLLLAGWGTQAALRALPETLPRAQNVALDARVLFFTFVISILAGVIFCLPPSLQTARPNLPHSF